MSRRPTVLGGSEVAVQAGMIILRGSGVRGVGEKRQRAEELGSTGRRRSSEERWGWAQGGGSSLSCLRFSPAPHPQRGHLLHCLTQVGP